MPTTKGRKKRPSKRGAGASEAWWGSPVFLIGAAAVVVILVLWWLLLPGDDDAGGLEDGVEAKLREMAASHRVEAGDLEADTRIRKIDGVFVRTWKLRFPDTASREEFIAELRILDDHESLTVSGPVDDVGAALEMRIDHGIEAYELELRVARGRRAYARPEATTVPTRAVPTPTPRPPPPPGATGRLAILLDDAGQKMDLVPAASRLPKEVGFAVLPFLPVSTESAVAFHEAGHEVWLHLPMEAVGGEDPGPGGLMVEMSDDELHDAVFMAVNNIPYLVGVNNHMGSRATANLKMMTWVMQDLAAMGLAFLDSRTTVDTVAEEAARAQGVKTGRRHVFLDNNRSRNAIRMQLEEAIYRSLTEDRIIAIGHLNELTISVLAEEIPRLKGRGVTLARPTELLD